MLSNNGLKNEIYILRNDLTINNFVGNNSYIIDYNPNINIIRFSSDNGVNILKDVYLICKEYYDEINVKWEKCKHLEYKEMGYQDDKYWYLFNLPNDCYTVID